MSCYVIVFICFMSSFTSMDREVWNMLMLVERTHLNKLSRINVALVCHATLQINLDNIASINTQISIPIKNPTMVWMVNRGGCMSYPKGSNPGFDACVLLMRFFLFFFCKRHVYTYNNFVYLKI